MQLSWLDAPDATTPATVQDLAAVGVTYRHLSTSPAVYEPALKQLCIDNRYVTRDEVALSPSMPNLQALLDKFKGEHLHTEDEVRFVLEGAGVFDIRSAADRWIRIQVDPGDLIVVPARLYHRFFLTDASQIRCVRLFQDATGWTPHYRG